MIKLNGKVWVGANVGLQNKTIQALHASALGGHTGIQAIYERITKVFTWTSLKLAVHDFVQKCTVCQQEKT